MEPELEADTDRSKDSSTRCSCESSQESDESSELDEWERDDSTRESIRVSPYMYEPEAEDSTSLVDTSRSETISPGRSSVANTDWSVLVRMA